MSGQAGGAANLVIGMGMNLAMSAQTDGITQPWVSLSEVVDGGDIDRNQLAINMIKTLHQVLDDYELSGMTGFVERWNRLDNFIGRKVKLIMGSREITGISQGINEQGAVILETDNGLETFIGGEISLRKSE